MLGDVRSIRRALEDGGASHDEALLALERAAHDAPTLALRLDACDELGAMSGRAFDAPWEIAERAAFVLLELAREADGQAERVGLLRAMGRGFRNLWLMPYVHSRLSDEDPVVVAAAIRAAGGLAFPALEEALASGFLHDATSRALRLAAIGALGRMGAESAASRLVPFVSRDPDEATAALAALTEIRSRVGEDAARDRLASDPPRDVLVAAMRYLAELGRDEVLATLRRLARDEDVELRLAAGLASRAFKAERQNDADGRILSALTERDRAVRAALARRLRTLPIAQVLEQAELLLADEPDGIVHVVAEVRAPEVTRFLLRIASDAGVDAAVRARAAGAIEANEQWERDALVALVETSRDDAVRAAAAQTIGAFAPPAYVLEHLAVLADDPSPALRAALLWALQLSARPRDLAGAERARAEAIVRGALGDADTTVRRRAAYVAGNLDAASLAPNLVELARREDEQADLRIAAFVALGEIASAARFADLVFLWNREDDPRALGAASRAIERAALASEPGSTGPRSAPTSAPPSLARVHDRLRKLLASPDAKVRAAAARVAGLMAGAAPADALAAMVDDASPRVREQAVTALGRAGGAAAEPALARAMADADAAIQERAAEALLVLGGATARSRVVDFVSRAPDRAAAARVAARITLPNDGVESFLDAIAGALARVPHDDHVYEALLELKLAALEQTRPAPSGGNVDASIAKLFPTWTRLSTVAGFLPLAKSLRTAEMLHASTARDADADLSAAIVLWMKCLEGYMHAWLGPRMRELQQRPAALWELADQLVGTSWPAYQRWLAERWADPVSVGALSVEVPLRSVVNALRELQERRLKSLDSPPSVTEWSRAMLFFALDHPSGPRNVLKVAGRDADRTARLAHRLQVLAQVRNAVTHRSVAGAATVSEFRRAYYAAFEELTTLA